MAYVASNQLAHSAAIGTSDVTLYTVPSGYRTIVKSIIAFNAHAGVNRVVFKVKSSGSTLAQLAYPLAALGSTGETVVELPWLVLLAAQSLTAVADSATVYAIVSGAELELP